MLLSQCSIVFICVAFLTFQQLTTGLICYSCEVCDGSINSNTLTTNVSDNAGYSCYKIVATSSGVSVVSRGVLMNCQAGSVNLNGVTGTVYCCATDRCNTAIARSSSLGLVLVMVATIVVLRTTIIG